MLQATDERERGAGPAPKPSVARSRCRVLSRQNVMQLGCLGRDDLFPENGKQQHVSHMF